MPNSPRENTSKLFQMMEEGSISYQSVAEMCLSYMSESEVSDMMEKNELIWVYDEDDEDEE